MDQQVAVNNPWNQRKEIGLFPAFFLTVKMLILKPREFFASLIDEKSLFGPVVFAGLLSIFLTIFEAILTIKFPHFYLMKNSTLNDQIVYFYASPMLAVLISFPAGLCAYWGARLLHGKGGYRDTFAICVYSGIAGLVTLFPKINVVVPAIISIIAFIWSSILMILGLEKMHDLTRSGAVKAFLVGLLIALGIIIAAGILTASGAFLFVASQRGVCPVMR